MAFPLDPSPEDMQEMGEASLAYLVDFIRQQPDLPAAGEPGGIEAARAARESPPEEGGEFKPVLEMIQVAAAKSYGTTGPGYLAFIPGGGLFAAALADFLATGINRFVNLWSTAPVVAQIENNVVRWLCDLFGYPARSRGILTSGGSMANFSAVVAARTALLPEEFLDGTLYVSDQVHASVTKAARLAGFGPRNIRVVPTSDGLRMDVAALQAMIGEDRRAGLRPFLVVGSVGTTNTGAIDPMADIASVARDERMWFHADAAYGGFFQLTDRGRAKFSGIERADSITLDPHKGMFLPYGTGSLVVRDGERLREAHFTGAAYLQDLAGDDEIPNFTEYSPELSRDFRGLRVWFPLKLHGVSAFRETLDEKLDLARVLSEGLRAIPELELPWAPELTVVPFRLRDGDEEANRKLLERINASQRVFLSSTIVRDRFILRACILSHRTHRDRIDECIEIVRRAVA
jgi:aromatic-L-amino-acid/L-tryptophan decarboxylase